jgi:hypothetical protein
MVEFENQEMVQALSTALKERFNDQVQLAP